MNVVDIKDIATLFASRAKLGDIEAEAFVNSMFTVIRQGLETDRQVKIRGFGTFKIIDVEARESVSVNTGERVVIDSHRKVTFTPDATMKELVNKPFSLFNTVPLNDGVEFADAEAETTVEGDAQEAEGETQEAEAEVQKVETVFQEPEPAVQTSEPEGQEPENNDVQAEETPQAEPETVVETSEEPVVEPVETQEGIVEESVPEETESAPVELENIPDEAESDSDEAESVPNETESVPEDTSIAPVEAPDEPVEESETVEEESQEDKTETPNSSHKALKITLYCLLTLVLMIASAYAGMLYGRLHANDDCALLCGTSSTKTSTAAVAAKEEAPQTKQQTETAQPVQPDTLAKASPDVKEKTVAEDKTPADKDAKQAGKEDKSTATADKKSAGKDSEVATMMQTANKYADKDVRVRTGAYCIVGTARTVTVSQGESLASISRRELGPGMDCYMETFNDLRSDATVKAGQTVKIPKLMLRKTLHKMAK